MVTKKEENKRTFVAIFSKTAERKIQPYSPLFSARKILPETIIETGVQANLKKMTNGFARIEMVMRGFDWLRQMVMNGYEWLRAHP